MASNTLMYCQSPAVDTISSGSWVNSKNPDPLRLDYGFIMDNVERVQNLSQHNKDSPKVIFTDFNLKFS